MSAHAMTATCTGSNGSNVGPLSGYLVQRPGGALARLKGRRKRWYVFDQHSCSLDSYKNDLDAASRKPPLFSIDLRNAAISFLVDEENCFVIHSGAKEYVFVAGNHESMMAWVMALQANRDLCREQEPINSVQVEEDDVVKRKISLPVNKTWCSVRRRAL
nr:TBC1 domain family member 2A-like [Rhipicephalus microplus]